MSNKFAEVAKNITSSSFIMDGRKKLKNEQIIAAYPKGFTIVAAELRPVKDKKTGDLDEMPVYLIAEDDTVYGTGGVALKNIFSEWVKPYDGDFEKMSAELKAAGGVKIRLNKTVTNEGKPYFAVVVID